MKTKSGKGPKGKTPDTEPIRLNKFIAHAGICSRREADQLIQEGKIQVNGKVVKELGIKIQPQDKVKYQGKILQDQKQVYLLLNKPKDFITTTKDPENRKTVMDLIKKSGEHRLFPVGRLDRNTTGLLLFTNDGDLAEKLSHPSNQVKKLYQIDLDKPLNKDDLERLGRGVQLEDGIAFADSVAIVSGDKKSIGLEIHSGKNRVVRRMFEALDYNVVKLDRVIYAGLTKKDLPRGHWRFLTKSEVIHIKHFQSPKRKSPS